MFVRRLRALFVLIFCTASVLTIARPAFADAPSNDNFAAADVLSSAKGAIFASNFDATEEPGEPNNAGESAPIQSVWYEWTAPSTGPFFFQTCEKTQDNSLDSTIGVYTGSAVDSLAKVADNDDACGYDGRRSHVTFTATGGTTYHISVDGWSDTVGDFILSWGRSNDNFANAESISGSSGSVGGTNHGFTGETGEPDNAAVSSPIESAWYAWTAPTTGRVAFDTCATTDRLADTTLGAYTGSSVSGLTSLAENNDSCGSFDSMSQISFRVEAGATYYISVDGYDGITGLFTLSWEYNNDYFDSAQLISGLSGSVSSDNVNFGGEPGEPSNAGVSEPIQSAWFKWIAPATVEISFDTCADDTEDTTLGVYTGSEVSDLSSIDQNNDVSCGREIRQSRVTFSAIEGTTYYISVDTWSHFTGTFTLAWGPPPPYSDLSVQINDSPDPVSLGHRVTYTIRVSNEGPDTAPEVTIHDLMDSTTTFVSYSASQGTCDTPAVGESGSLECAIGNVAKGADETVTLKVKTSEIAVIENDARVESTAADVTPDDQFDTEETNVRPVNLLRNGGFEVDADNDGRPDGWTSNPNFTRRSAQVFSGKSSGRHRATTNSSYVVQQTVSKIVAEAQYAFSGRVNIPATTDAFIFTLQVRWRNSANKVLGRESFSGYTASTGDWDSSNGEFVAPPGAVKADIRMIVNGLKATIYVDQFEFYRT
ncbi:MAG TPA: DUF11 domain-containing protein [Actinomycetota bacterium]